MTFENFKNTYNNRPSIHTEELVAMDLQREDRINHLAGTFRRESNLWRSTNKAVSTEEKINLIHADLKKCSGAKFGTVDYNECQEVFDTEYEVDVYSKYFEENCKDSPEDSLADAFIRILDLAGSLDIDFGKAVMLKMQYREKRF